MEKYRARLLKAIQQSPYEGREFRAHKGLKGLFQTYRKPLPAHADSRKREHGTRRNRVPHRHRGPESGEDKHPLHLRKKILRVTGIRYAFVILGPAIGLDPSFDPQILRVNRTHRTERALLQFRSRV